MALDYKALDGYNPDKVFPADVYQAEITKVSPGEKGTNFVLTIRDYHGKKKDGADAIGKEFSVFIAAIGPDTADFIKEKSKLLLSTLLKATDIVPEEGMDEVSMFTGRVVLIALDVQKDSHKIRNINYIKYFVKP